MLSIISTTLTVCKLSFLYMLTIKGGSTHARNCVLKIDSSSFIQHHEKYFVSPPMPEHVDELRSFVNKNPATFSWQLLHAGRICIMLSSSV